MSCFAHLEVLPSGSLSAKMNVQRSGSSAYWDSDAWNPDDRVYVGASDGQTHQP